MLKAKVASQFWIIPTIGEPDRIVVRERHEVLEADAIRLSFAGVDKEGLTGAGIPTMIVTLPLIILPG